MNALLWPVLIPSLAALIVSQLGRWPNIREGLAVIAGGATVASLLPIAAQVIGGGTPAHQVLALTGDIRLTLHAEPLSLIFAFVAAGLWPITTIYAAGYMRGNDEAHQTRFFTCFALSIGAAQAVALSANLATLFVAYEALTLSTWPLVTHKGDANARAGGRTYIAYLLGSSVALLLPAIIWTFAIAGTLEFRPGGILRGHDASPTTIAVLYALFMFGIGKAALMPMHRWLPAAMVAPTPVSALLHAVAVVKAGVFVVLKVTVYVFGLDYLRLTNGAESIAILAAISLVAASLIALRADNLKRRLAYSTVSQLAYVTLAAACANLIGAVGGALHIVLHACGKITLFFCAGAIYTAAHKTLVSQLDGLGRRMPWTFAAFTLGALSIIGIPPLGGSWSKWWIIQGGLEADYAWVVPVLLASTLLNIAYLLPIPVRGYLLPADPADHGHEAGLALLLPLLLTAALCLVLFVAAPWLAALLSGGLA